MEQTTSKTMAGAAARRAESLVQLAEPDGMETVRVQIPGKGSRIVAFWPRRAGKLEGDFARLWSVIDGNTDSMTTLAARLVGSMDAAATDENLSPVGRRAAVGDAARQLAGMMQAPAARFMAAKARLDELDKDLAGIDPYRQSEPWRWHQDIEVARTVRELPDDQRTSLRRALELGEHPEVSEALCRVPAYLTGLAPHRLGNIRAALVELKNPGFGGRAELRSQALKAAADAVNAVAKLIEGSGWMTSEEARMLMGATVAEVRVFAGQPIVELVDAPQVEPAGAVAI